MLIPWSAFWDHNYFVEVSSGLGRVLTSNYTRGALTGLGLLNIWAALAELGEVLGGRSTPPKASDHQSSFDNPQ